MQPVHSLGATTYSMTISFWLYYVTGAMPTGNIFQMISSAVNYYCSSQDDPIRELYMDHA